MQKHVLTRLLVNSETPVRFSQDVIESLSHTPEVSSIVLFFRCASSWTMWCIC